jgi:hypothetical protein
MRNLGTRPHSFILGIFVSHFWYSVFVVTVASGLSNVNSGKNDELKWRITEPFRKQINILSLFYFQIVASSQSAVRNVQHASGQMSLQGLRRFRANRSSLSGQTLHTVCSMFIVDVDSGLIILGQSASWVNCNDDNGYGSLRNKTIHSVIFMSASGIKLLLAKWRWRRYFT